MLIENPPVAITDSLTMLGTTEYSLFLLKGPEKAVLFEGSIGPMGPLVLQQLRQLGVPKEMVKEIVVSHAHPDHVMAIPFLRKHIPGLQVVASVPAAKSMALEESVAFFCEVDQAMSDALAEEGTIPTGYRQEPIPEKKIGVQRTVKEGDTITAGAETSFTVLETPGHSACSLCFHDKKDGVLLVADATGFYLPRQDFFWPDYFLGYGIYMTSLERLRNCSATYLGLSHNGVIKGVDAVRSYLDLSIQRSKEFHERVLRAYKKVGRVRPIAEKLGTEVYAHTQSMPLEFLQKHCGLLVKNSLKHEGITPVS